MYFDKIACIVKKLTPVFLRFSAQTAQESCNDNMELCMFHL